MIFMPPSDGHVYLDVGGISKQWAADPVLEDFLYRSAYRDDDGGCSHYIRLNDPDKRPILLFHTIDITDASQETREQYLRIAQLVGIFCPDACAADDLQLAFSRFTEKRGAIYAEMQRALTGFPATLLDDFIEYVKTGNKSKIPGFFPTTGPIQNTRTPPGHWNDHNPLIDYGALTKGRFNRELSGYLKDHSLVPKPAPKEREEDIEVVGELKERVSTFEGFRAYVSQVVADVAKKVKGQEEAIRDLTIKLVTYVADPNSQRYPVLLTGPTGCGKTLTVREVCQRVGMPFFETSVPTLSPASYRGTNIQTVLHDMVSRAIKECGGYPSRLVIYLDEFGKILKRGNGDNFSQQIQNEFLKLLEPGATVAVSNMFETMSQLPLRAMIVCSDAFSFIEGPVSKEALREEGMTAELAGRLQLVAPFRPLEESDYVEILTTAEDSIIEQKKRTVAAIGAVLEVDPEAIQAMARLAATEKSGGRGLNQRVSEVIEKRIKEATFSSDELPKAADGKPIIWVRAKDVPLPPKSGNGSKPPIGFVRN